ncbi:hypothetical protein PanWU01x14_318420 [Parasponia andersonii]|uniref:Uncharacterized protein n=1 Tax=Parasponia andersonii TaxID=3476 RepID=A0A2P5AMB6_PARAD|nr:hypothetical protein PanWU01x14_318420 [Parasponia andersonii]
MDMKGAEEIVRTHGKLSRSTLLKRQAEDGAVYRHLREGVESTRVSKRCRFKVSDGQCSTGRAPPTPILGNSEEDKRF